MNSVYSRGGNSSGSCVFSWAGAGAGAGDDAVEAVFLLVGVEEDLRLDVDDFFDPVDDFPPVI